MKKKELNVFVLGILLFIAFMGLTGCSNPLVGDDSNNTENTKIIESNDNSVDTTKLNLGLYIAGMQLAERIESKNSPWNEKSVIAGYYPVYTPGIDGVSHYEFKIQTDGNDAGYILVSVTENDLQIPEMSESGLTITETYRNALNTNDFKVYRYNWFESAAESTTRGIETKVLATMGFNGVGLNVIDETRGANEFEEEYSNLKEIYSEKVKENGCLPFYSKEAIKNYYDTINRNNATRGNVEMPYKKTEEAYLDNIFKAKYQSYSMQSVKLDTGSGYGYITLRVTYMDDSFQDVNLAFHYNSQITLARNDVKMINYLSAYYSGAPTNIMIKYGNSNFLRIYSSEIHYKYSKNQVLWDNSNGKLYGWSLPRWTQPKRADGLFAGCGNVAWAQVYAYWHQFKGKNKLLVKNNAPIDISSIADSIGCDSKLNGEILYDGFIYNMLWNDLYWMTNSGRFGNTASTWTPPWDNSSARDMSDGKTYAENQGYKVSVDHKNGWNINDIYNSVSDDKPVILLINGTYYGKGIGVATHYVVTEGVIRKYWSNNPSVPYEGGYYCNWGWGNGAERKWIYICYEEQAAELFVLPFAGKDLYSIYDSYIITIN